jgi:predicted dehydrogenase
MSGLPLKVAVMGSGMIANKAHIPAFKCMGEDRVRVAAVFDTREEAARGTAERHGIPAWYSDAGSMLAEVKPDLVSVCSPNASHRAMAEMALESGAHVLCEKPVALTYADTKSLFETAKRKGLHIAACQVQRYGGEFATARELAEAGIFGDIYYGEISLIRRRGIPKWGTFHLKESNGGGAFCDLGVHMVDALLWIMGNPMFESIIGMSESRLARREEEIGLVTNLAESGAPSGVENARPYSPGEFEVEEFAAGSLRVAGALINFRISWALNLPPDFHVSFSGERAGARLPELEVYSTLGRYQSDTRPKIYRGGRYEVCEFPGHYYLVDDFLNFLSGNGPIPVKPEETLNVAAVIDAFYISAREGREVRAEEIKG